MESTRTRRWSFIYNSPGSRGLTIRFLIINSSKNNNLLANSKGAINKRLIFSKFEDNRTRVLVALDAAVFWHVSGADIV